MAQEPSPSGTKSADERKQLLSQNIQMAIGAGGRIESQSDYMAVVLSGKKVNHILHLILSLLTGIWVVVWIAMVMRGGEKRQMITVDEYGNVLNQRM